MSINQRSSVRIISGSKRGSKIFFKQAPGLRPSSDRIRETLFAWLQSSIAGSCCLDMFAGSGALGFEAASRGAAKVVMLENNRSVVESLNENIKRLRFDNVDVIAADATQAAVYDSPVLENHRFDLVFIDPPFTQMLYHLAFERLQQHQLLSQSALVYVETNKRAGKVVLPQSWELEREKVAGEVRVQLYRVIADTRPACNDNLGPT